jgi:hypothetical protein
MKNGNEMKLHITILTIIIAVTTFLSTGCMYAKQKTVIWDTTICTVYDISQAGKFIKIAYNVNGKTYHDITGGWDEDAYVGEKFLIYYDRNKPSENDIDFTQPVFEKDEKTFFTIGKIVKIKEKKFFFTTNRLRYGFIKSDGTIIKRNMTLPDNYKNKFPNLKSGQYYKIQVWEENIYRSILRLDLGLVEDSAD